MMTAMDPGTPLLVGWSAVHQREQDHRHAEDALGLMLRAARSTLPPNRAETVLAQVDWVGATEGTSDYGDPARLVAQGIGAAGARTVLARVGVSQQSLVSEACRQVGDGAATFALVVGGEARHRAARAAAAGDPAPAGAGRCPTPPDEERTPTGDLVLGCEVAAGLRAAPGFYALVESEWRARAGMDPDRHRDHLAAMYSRFSEIAAANPRAVRRRPRSPAELRDPSERNPMVAFPYTKLLVSTWTVDQAAALLFCTAATAGRHRLDRSGWVFPLVAAESNHCVPVTARPRLTQPAAIGAMADAARAHAGLDPGACDLLDLYSCFPVAVTLAAEGLGVDGGRDLTVTGGMSFAGGPFNNYALQAMAETAERLRDGAGATGLVSSVSGLYTKQGFTVLGTAPPARPFAALDVTAEVDRREPPRPVDPSATGAGTIAAATVLYDRGAPERAVAVVDLPGGGRTIGASHDDPEMSAVLGGEPVGRAVTVDAGRLRLGHAARPG